MDNNKKIRLIQVAKEFKVGFNTLADYLQRKGLQSDCSPSSPVSAEVYAALEKEFGGNRQSGGERDAVRERIQQKGSVSINSQNAKDEDDYEEEDVALTEFADEIDGWIIDALKSAGCDTAKSVLDLTIEQVAQRADLEIEQAEQVVAILKAEFE